MWYYEDLDQYLKIIFTGALLFTTYTAFNSSKVVRDVADAKAKPPTAAFTFFTFVFTIISLACLFGALYLLPFTESQRKFCLSGSFYVLSSTVAVAKIVRDREERTARTSTAARPHEE